MIGWPPLEKTLPLSHMWQPLMQQYITLAVSPEHSGKITPVQPRQELIPSSSFGQLKCQQQRCRFHSPESVSREKKDLKRYIIRTKTTQRCFKVFFCIVLLMADLITPIGAALWPNEFLYSRSLIIKCKSSPLLKSDLFFPANIITRLVPVRF